MAVTSIKNSPLRMILLEGFFKGRAIFGKLKKRGFKKKGRIFRQDLADKLTPIGKILPIGVSDNSSGPDRAGTFFHSKSGAEYPIHP